jgi:hypothetical protein
VLCARGFGCPVSDSCDASADRRGHGSDRELAPAPRATDLAMRNPDRGRRICAIRSANPAWIWTGRLSICRSLNGVTRFTPPDRAIQLG